MSVTPRQFVPTVSAPRRRAGRNLPSTEPVWLKGCILCGGSRFGSDYPSHFPWLSHCQDCGLRQARPQPSDAELARVYDDDYYKTFGFDPLSAGRYRTMKQASFDRLLEVAERHFRIGRLLDVGSALGDLLAAAIRRGWDVRGVEPIPFAASRADEVAPGATFTGTLEEMDPAEQGFDLVTCVDVIEHLRRPDQTLSRMYRCLRPGGGALIATNDVEDARSRTMGPRWPHYHVDHLWYFSQRTLSALAEAAGFEVVSVQRARKIFNLSYVLGILAHSPNHRALQRFARIALRTVPEPLLRLLLPPVQEGFLLLARRPRERVSKQTHA